MTTSYEISVHVKILHCPLLLYSKYKNIVIQWRPWPLPRYFTSIKLWLSNSKITAKGQLVFVRSSWQLFFTWLFFFFTSSFLPNLLLLLSPVFPLTCCWLQAACCQDLLSAFLWTITLLLLIFWGAPINPSFFLIEGYWTVRSVYHYMCASRQDESMVCCP